MNFDLVPLDVHLIDPLLVLMEAYYSYDQLDFKKGKARRAVMQLLSEDHLGRIWLISVDGKQVGYLALAFGFSLEFGGRDAFIDEFFILEECRNQGVGTGVLQLVEKFLSQQQVQAIHLEVNQEHEAAKQYYRSQGYHFRERFHLMSKDLSGLDQELSSMI